jgi:hypothetical protein
VPVWAKWLLGFLWDKLFPIVVGWVKKVFRKTKIAKEEDEKRKHLEDAIKQAKDWLQKNPGKPLPKELEDALRDASHKHLRMQ